MEDRLTMRLEMYHFKNPISRVEETVYEYPLELATLTLQFRTYARLVTREPMMFPILVVPPEYLEKIPNHLKSTSEVFYASLEFADYKEEQEIKKEKQDQHDSKIDRVRELFSVGTAHLRSCKSFFFTGPVAVYKKSFTENWVYNNETGKLTLGTHGYFDTIDSLSLKGLNDVFITGLFVYSEKDKMLNTQVKITVARA